MNIPSVSCDKAGAETLTYVLPNEVLLLIFRYFHYEDLTRVEQVCLQWKTVVEMCFATERRLSLAVFVENNSDSLKRMKRYGSSIKTLNLGVHVDVDCAITEVNWAEEIAHRFPNLITMALHHIRISDDGFKYLSTKCCQLKNLCFRECGFTIEGLRIFLQALPGIEVLKFFKDKIKPRLEIPNLADILAVLSNCRNLHTFVMAGTGFRCIDTGFRCIETASFSRFFKECVTLRNLRILHSYLPNVIFAQIQHCSLLEELDLDKCYNVNDSTLIEISNGCPNLRVVSLVLLPLVSDEGLKCFARCKNLYSFRACELQQVTDETLVELSKCVNLTKVKFWRCPLVSDRGCAALLAHCPQLELLNVYSCQGVGNSTVDSAIGAVQCRQNGLVLKLAVNGTSVTPHNYDNCHPLLHLSYN